MARTSSNGAKNAVKLQINDDGTIGVPIRGDDGEPRVLLLKEPTLTELASIHEAVAAADEEMPKLPTLPNPPGEQATSEERGAFLVAVQDWQKVSRDRTVRMFGSDSPYGEAFTKIVSLLSGEDVNGDQLYGWAMNAKACRTVLDHFTAPLDGPDDDSDVTPLLRLLGAT